MRAEEGGTCKKFAIRLGVRIKRSKRSIGRIVIHLPNQGMATGVPT